MNGFLEKYGYSLEKKGNSVIITQRRDNFGCIHILFVSLVIPTAALSYFIHFFALFLIPIFFIYFIEIDKRKKHARRTTVNYERQRFEIVNKKGDVKEEFHFAQARSVISTNEHIGGYATSNKDTTEEFRKEINVLFKDGKVLTVFSFLSESNDEELEIRELVDWLEKILEL